MSELQGRVNAEYELKLITDADGLQAAKSWVSTHVRLDLGHMSQKRSHIYYDTKQFVLRNANWTLRRSAEKFSYCLKFPIETRGHLLARREIFSTDLEYPLDIKNSMHQRSPIFSRILPLMEENKVNWCVEEFVPRIRIDCQREYRFVADSENSRWGVAFDNVSAYACEDGRHLLSWMEVELETGWGFPERIDIIQQIADELSNIGLKPTLDGKYKIGSYGLESVNLPS